MFFFYNIWINQFAWMDTWNKMILAIVTLQGRYSLLDVPIYSVLKDTTIRMQLDNFNYTSSHTYIITSYVSAPSPGHSRTLHLPLLDESLSALSEPQDDKVHS